MRCLKSKRIFVAKLAQSLLFNAEIKAHLKSVVNVTIPVKKLRSNSWF